MDNMLGKYVIALLLLMLVSVCTGDKWLMYGDFIANSETLEIESTNSTTSVSSSMRITLTSPPNHRINCVLAAALHMNGDVSVVSGGVGASNVTLTYETINGIPDLFFVLIESHTDKGLVLRDNMASNSRVTILYDRLRDWGLHMTKEEFRGDIRLPETPLRAPLSGRNEG